MEKVRYCLSGVWLGQYLFNEGIEGLSVALAERALVLPPRDHGEAGHLLCCHASPFAYVPGDHVRSTVPLSLVVIPNASSARREFNQRQSG